MAALLPPSSRIARAKRAASFGATLPAHRGRAGGGDERHPLVLDQALAELPAADQEPEQAPRGRPHRSASPAFIASAWTASAVSGVFSEGFQTTGSPQTRAKRGVPGPDRHGDVERRDDAAHPERVPDLHHPVVRPLGGDGEPVQLPRQADGEVADVDHLLDLAEALREDFSRLERHQPAEIVLWARNSSASSRTSSPRRGPRHPAPGEEGCCAPASAASASSGVVGRKVATTPPSIASAREPVLREGRGRDARRSSTARVSSRPDRMVGAWRFLRV